MLRVLTYHRVAEPQEFPWLDPALISATPAAFDRQMRFLAGHYNVVSVKQVLDAIDGGRALPKRAVLITFDDAYSCFALHAWPILKRNRLPASLFVPTAYPEDPLKPFWWDRLYQAHSFGGSSKEQLQKVRRLVSYLKTIPHSAALQIIDEICAKSAVARPVRPSLLDWDQIRRLGKEGVTIGSHSYTHPIMTQITPMEVEEEIRRSFKDLRQQLGSVLPIFCYPSGRFDARVVDCLKKERVALAFTTAPGTNDLQSRALAVRRTNITRRTTLPVFRLRMLAVGNCIDRWRYAA